MTARRSFSDEEARAAALQLGLDWSASAFDLEQLRRGMEIELEHGTRDRLTDVTGDDPVTTAEIALAHLHEIPDYYDRLEEMETTAKRSPGGLRTGSTASGAGDPIETSQLFRWRPHRGT